MSEQPKLVFDTLQAPITGTIVLFADDTLSLGHHASALNVQAGDVIASAAKSAKFTGKQGSALDLYAPRGLELERVLVIGLGKLAEYQEADWLRLGGVIAGKLAGCSCENITILMETPLGALDVAQAADVALGIKLGSYSFQKYKVKKADKDMAGKPAKISLAVSEPAAAKKAYGKRQVVGQGVHLARDLVNLPPNDLGSHEFAKTCEKLTDLGVEVEILSEKDMKKLGMNALLGVGLGSERESKIVIMRWNGAKEGAHPIAFIGKGVTFDYGGISLKPGTGMEDMKGDMAGAACVTGLMHALAARKAKVNVVGLIGLVENMPDGKAQRPGDIVTSMSGQTIEIINTDAEGRLVLADVLWYCQERFKPQFMVNLATLTGAILIALGKEHAGLFSNNDALSQNLLAAGLATGEKLWRLPMSADYDKLIDSQFADMKNTGGRDAGSITAAQFLERFVNGVPWAHLDIAGTGMAAKQTDTNRSWGSGFGVRLLDRLVADHYEG